MYKIYDADVYYGFFIELKDLIPFMDEDWQKEYNEMLKIKNDVERADEKDRLVDDYLAGETPLEKDGVKFDVKVLPMDMYGFYDIEYDQKKDVLIVGIHQKHLNKPHILDLMAPFHFREQQKMRDMYENGEFEEIEKLFLDKTFQEP